LYHNRAGFTTKAGKICLYVNFRKAKRYGGPKHLCEIVHDFASLQALNIWARHIGFSN